MSYSGFYQGGPLNGRFGEFSTRYPVFTIRDEKERRTIRFYYTYVDKSFCNPAYWAYTGTD